MVICVVIAAWHGKLGVSGDRRCDGARACFPGLTLERGGGDFRVGAPQPRKARLAEESRTKEYR